MPWVRLFKFVDVAGNPSLEVLAMPVPTNVSIVPEVEIFLTRYQVSPTYTLPEVSTATEYK